MVIQIILDQHFSYEVEDMHRHATCSDYHNTLTPKTVILDLMVGRLDGLDAYTLKSQIGYVANTLHDVFDA